jgi:ATPase subunit of ABC transporter with duplicated ATPase domains
MPRPRGVLAARSISKSYGEVPVLDGVSLTVGPGDRVGVVGPNGIGKSTLLRVLAGLEDPDGGTVRREPAGLAVAYVPQERLAAGVSGGEAARRRLEELLASEADVVLLDEPTNDLDTAALELLERFVVRHRGGLVVVSHDRAFLERMTRIVELEAETRRVREYPGGWSSYEAERTLDRARHLDAYRGYAERRSRVEEQARRMREWEQRGYGQGRKKKKGKDAAKLFDRKLERIAVVEKPWTPWRLQLELAPARRTGDVVARLERAVVRRGESVLGPIDLELAAGERLAIAGRNGTGKSTLVGALTGRLELESGSRWIGPGVVIGELPQDGAGFAPDAPLLGAFAAEAGLPPGEARSLLARFALGADDVERRVGSLSPGERSRARLALLASRGVNALVLDEPTNHLDLEAIEQLEEALVGFKGTVVAVSHDRRFLEAFAATRTIWM